MYLGGGLLLTVDPRFSSFLDFYLLFSMYRELIVDMIWYSYVSYGLCEFNGFYLYWQLILGITGLTFVVWLKIILPLWDAAYKLIITLHSSHYYTDCRNPTCQRRARHQLTILIWETNEGDSKTHKHTVTSFSLQESNTHMQKTVTSNINWLASIQTQWHTSLDFF